MGLFGRKKDPSALVAEGKKLSDLVLDWLREPLGALRNAAVSDRVMAEHYLLVLCTYIAREKISPAARDYVHNALAQTSPYCQKYAKDIKSEINLLAVMLSTLENAEKSARRSRANVMEALVKNLFKDFSTYQDPQLVKRVVYMTLNQFNEEIPTTDYAKLRLEVPAAAQASRTAAPARPAAPAPVAAPKKADYVFYTADTNEPLEFNRMGRRIIHQDRVYELVKRRGGDHQLLILDVSEPKEVIVNDQTIFSAVGNIFLRQNPELSYILKVPAPERDLPGYFTLKTGDRAQRVDVAIWMEMYGSLFAYCPRKDGTFELIKKIGDGYGSVPEGTMRDMVIKEMQKRYPLLFD